MKVRATAAAVLLALYGCATSVEKNRFEPSQADLDRLHTKPSIEAIGEAEEFLKRSRQKELDLLAPQHFTLANQTIAEARELLDRNQPPERIVQKVAVAEAVIKSGERVANSVRATLADELSIKETLDDLDTQKIYKGEYGNLINRLNEIIRQVENGKKNEAIAQRKKLLKDMANLEKKSIRYNALHEAEEILRRVKYRGGPKLAPMTYEEALQVYAKAEAFIEQNPHMNKAVAQMGKEALFAAKRVLYITEEVAALGQKVDLSLEQVVLDEEYRLYRIARALTDEDVRDHPLEVQSELLSKTVSELNTQHGKQEDLIIALRDTLIKVRDASSKSTIVAKTKQYKKEKGEWLAKEALYSAKVSQLENEIETKKIQLVEINQQLGQKQSAIAQLEIQNNLIQQQLEQREVITSSSPGLALQDTQKPATESYPIGESAAKGNALNDDAPVIEANPIATAEASPYTDSTRLAESTEIVSSDTPISSSSILKQQASIIDKSSADIIADLMLIGPQTKSPVENSEIAEQTKETPSTEAVDNTDNLTGTSFAAGN